MLSVNQGDTLRVRIILNEVKPSRGRGAKEKNCKNFLDALWRIAALFGLENTIVERRFLGAFWKPNSALMRAAKELENLEALAVVKQNGPGNPVVELKLLKREVEFPKKPVTKKEKVVIPQPITEKSLRRGAETTTKTKAEPDKPTPIEHIFAFVDVPNFKGPNIKDKDEKEVLNLSFMDWGLFYDLLKNCHSSNKMPKKFWAKAYLFMMKNALESYGHQIEQWPLTKTIREGGFNVFCRKWQRDIDGSLAAEMTFIIMNGLLKSEIKPGDTVSIVLVSGDGGYADPINKMRIFLKKRDIFLHTTVVSWGKINSENFTSAALKRVADKIIPINSREVLGKIYPYGYTRLEEVQQ